MNLTFSVAETTMFSPTWSTLGTYDTYYSFQNTTPVIIHGFLTLRDAAGNLVASGPANVPAGGTLFGNTSSLAVARGRTGTATLVHDGPPGAIVVAAAVANFTFAHPYIQPVKFDAVRQVR